MENNTVNVGEFSVAPEALTQKATEIQTRLLAMAESMKSIENTFNEIEKNKFWEGQLANKYFDNLHAFFKGGANIDGAATSGSNVYSATIEAYAEKVFNFLNDASNGYLTTDQDIEKSVSGETDESALIPQELNEESTTTPTTEDQTTEAAELATDITGTTAAVSGVAGTVGDVETTTPATTTRKHVSDERYEVPEGKTYAKRVQSINSLSKEKNEDGSYYYKASAIAYGGTDSSGKKWNTKTEEGTGLRYIEEDGEKYYCAAMGTAYGQAGDKVRVTTDTGNTFNVIITDSKSVYDAENVQIDGETYSQYHYWDGEVKDLVELNCEYSKIPKNVRNMGSWHVLDQFSGNITSIEPIE